MAPYIIRLCMLVAAVALHRELASALHCVRVLTPCVCQTNYKGFILNLTALDAGGITNVQFTYTDKDVVPPPIYKYNPCSPFYCTENTAAICLEKSRIQHFPLGEQSTARFSNMSYADKDSITLKYTAAGGLITSDVLFECRPGVFGVFSLVDYAPDLYYTFKVETQFACVDLPTPPAPYAQTVSIGLVILLAFISIVCVYILVGCAVNRRDGRHGLEALPHYPFWAHVSENISIGCAFFCMRVRDFCA